MVLQIPLSVDDRFTVAAQPSPKYCIALCSSSIEHPSFAPIAKQQDLLSIIADDRRAGARSWALGGSLPSRVWPIKAPFPGCVAVCEPGVSCGAVGPAENSLNHALTLIYIAFLSQGCSSPSSKAWEGGILYLHVPHSCDTGASFCINYC